MLTIEDKINYMISEHNKRNNTRIAPIEQIKWRGHPDGENWQELFEALDAKPSAGWSHYNSYTYAAGYHSYEATPISKRLTLHHFINRLIKEANEAECLTSNSVYIRECRKWFNENS